MKDYLSEIIHAPIGKSIWDHHYGIPLELNKHDCFHYARVTAKAAQLLIADALGDEANSYMNKMVIKTHEDDRSITMAAIYDNNRGYIFSLSF